MRAALLILLLCDLAWGSYRVHRLKVRHYDAYGRLKRTEFVLSSLDHVQYEHYHGGYRWDRVELVDTWYCPGDTSRRRFCPKPKVKDRLPAALRDTRVPIPYTRQPIIP